jgi:hypothetical protein
MTIEREIEGLERDERALEKAASALERLATVAEKFYAALWPEKRIARDAKLSTVRTAQEEELAETIQGSERTLEQWQDIGPREREFIDKSKKSS